MIKLHRQNKKKQRESAVCVDAVEIVNLFIFKFYKVR